MRIFLDANILVALINIEYPVFDYSTYILSLNENKFEIWTSPICLAIAFYFASKKYGDKHAFYKIKTLSKKLKITSVNASTVNSVIENKFILDFEDGIEYYSTMEQKCDKEGFYFSIIPVMNSKSFVQMMFN